MANGTWDPWATDPAATRAVVSAYQQPPATSTDPLSYLSDISSGIKVANLGAGLLGGGGGALGAAGAAMVPFAPPLIASQLVPSLIDRFLPQQKPGSGVSGNVQLAYDPQRGFYESAIGTHGFPQLALEDYSQQIRNALNYFRQQPGFQAPQTGPFVNQEFGIAQGQYGNMALPMRYFSSVGSGADPNALAARGVSYAGDPTQNAVAYIDALSRANRLGISPQAVQSWFAQRPMPDPVQGYETLGQFGNLQGFVQSPYGKSDIWGLDPNVTHYLKVQGFDPNKVRGEDFARIGGRADDPITVWSSPDVGPRQQAALTAQLEATGLTPPPQGRQW
jgi:hypothetical protein